MPTPGTAALSDEIFEGVGCVTKCVAWRLFDMVKNTKQMSVDL